jgi:hypothetical protein
MTGCSGWPWEGDALAITNRMAQRVSDGLALFKSRGGRPGGSDGVFRGARTQAAEARAGAGRLGGPRGGPQGRPSAVAERRCSPASVSRRPDPTGRETSRARASCGRAGSPASRLLPCHYTRIWRLHNGNGGGTKGHPLPGAGCVEAAQSSSLRGLATRLWKADAGKLHLTAHWP